MSQLVITKALAKAGKHLSHVLHAFLWTVTTPHLQPKKPERNDRAQVELAGRRVLLEVMLAECSCPRLDVIRSCLGLVIALTTRHSHATSLAAGFALSVTPLSSSPPGPSCARIFPGALQGLVTRLSTYCKGSAVSTALYSSQWHMFALAEQTPKTPYTPRGTRKRVNLACMNTNI